MGKGNNFFVILLFILIIITTAFLNSRINKLESKYDQVLSPSGSSIQSSNDVFIDQLRNEMKTECIANKYVYYNGYFVGDKPLIAFCKDECQTEEKCIKDYGSVFSEGCKTEEGCNTACKAYMITNNNSQFIESKRAVCIKERYVRDLQ